MMLLQYYSRNLLIFSFIAGLLIVFFGVNGCDNESEYRRIDFSQTTPFEHTGAGQHRGRTLNVAVSAMVSPQETLAIYFELLEYVGRKLDHRPQLIQRKTYGEINRLLGRGEVDIAFLCTGPYISGREEYGFEAVATPVIRGEPLYQAYLIVHRDSPFQHLEDLKGRVFAFTDPESHTGALVPSYWLAELGEKPGSYFRRIHFTHSHDNSILAVARGLVEGASVDGHIWEYYHARNPMQTTQTRVIRKSRAVGAPPLVASRHLEKELKDSIRRIVVEMHKDPKGQAILTQLLIDRFEPARAQWYQGIAEMKSRLGDIRE